MKYVVKAAYTNGFLPGYEIAYDDLQQAKNHADTMFRDPGFKNVEITEPVGVIVTYKNGTRKAEYCKTWAEAVNAAASMQRVINNRKVNGHPAVKVEAIGFRGMTAKPTAEDILIGAWHAAALSDHKVCPSMKYDINAWIDSKDWT